jgi:hypothetical protein
MRHQGLEIEDTAFQALEARRPCVAVAIDESEIDLVSLISTDNRVVSSDSGKRCTETDGAATKRIDTDRWMPQKLTSASDRCINGRLFMISLPTPITITVPPLLAV